MYCLFSWNYHIYITYKTQGKTQKGVNKKKIVPIVKVIVAKSQNYQMIIKANGEVKPISIANIVPEVKGRITYVSPNLRQGNMVKKRRITCPDR